MQATLELIDQVSSPAKARKTLPQSLVLASPAIALAILLILPFLNKAYTIDEPMDLIESAQVMRDFWHPLHFDICWDSPTVCAAAPLVIPNVALTAYFLLPATWFGSPEWLVHTLQLGALFLGLMATVSIALRLGFRPLEASLVALFVVALPSVLVYTNSANPDILAMALAAAGIDRLLLWRQERSLRSGILAGVLLGLAPLARPQLLLLIPIAVLAVAFGPGMRLVQRIRSLWFVAVSLAVFATGILLTKEPEVHAALVPGRLLALSKVAYNTFSYFWYLVVPFPFGIAWMLGAGRRRVALLLGAAGLLIALTALGKVNIWVALAVVCACCGAFTLCATFYRAIRERSFDVMFLVAWMAIPLAAVSYVHLPPKYFIASAPAIAILVVGFLRKRRSFTTLAGTVIAASLCLCWLTLRADAEFAGKARLAAEDLIRPQTAAGSRVWFTGDWGIYWYAQRAGAKVLMPAGPQPVTGDLLLVGAEGAVSGWEQRFPHRSLLARREYVSRFGRTMSHEARAGLHSNVVGLLPWSPANGYLDSYDLWRID